MRALKVIDANGSGRLCRDLRKMACSQKARSVLDFAIAPLNELQNNPQARSTFLKSSVDFAVVSYCSVFNSNRKNHDQCELSNAEPRHNDGIGLYDIGQVHTDELSKEYHRKLVSYRDKDIAHLTNFSHRDESFFVSSTTRGLYPRVLFDRTHYCNECQPGLPEWERFISHLKTTRQWFYEEHNRLSEKINLFLKSQHTSFFDSFPDADKADKAQILLLEKFAASFLD